jgi:hypothetical protein
MKATALSEIGRVVAGERHGMCESAFNTAGEQQGNGMVCVNRPLLLPLTAALLTFSMYKYKVIQSDLPTQQFVHVDFVCVQRAE